MDGRVPSPQELEYVALSYRVAATASIVSRGRAVPRGELHAYLYGKPATVCGRPLGDDMVAFDSLRWSARPIGLTTCRVCFSVAR